jgi:O-acetyl-ADP-ribose deacetylase
MDEAINRIEVVTNDITALRVDAIVNTANESLLGGEGVDGAIHRAAGPGLLEHCKTLEGCPTGLAKITPAFGLEEQDIKHIIHTVGPVWHGDDSQKLGYTLEDTLLASCYHQSLTLAAEHACNAVAFPNISTGAYRFPKHRAAKIAFGHVLGFLDKHDLPEKIILCCFSDADAQVVQEAIDTHGDWMFNRKRMG